MSLKHNRSDRESLNALPEYIDVEYMLACTTRLWEVEEDYKQVAIAENCAHFIQYWCRRHQQRKRNRLGQQINFDFLARKTFERSEDEKKRISLMKHQKDEEMRKYSRR